jgi:hypothetical protein
MTRLGRASLIIVALGVVAVLTTVGAYPPGRPEGVSSKAVSFNDLGPDLLEKRSLQLVGPNAVDYGRVALRANPKKATNCALQANQAGKPFRVRYEWMGVDSYVAHALVRLPDGTVQALSYDSDAMGGGRQRGAEVVSHSQCPTPIHLYTTIHGQLTCVPPKPPNGPPNR